MQEESWGYFAVHLFRNWAWQRCVWYSLVAGRPRSPPIPPPRGLWLSGTWQVRRTTACLPAGWWWKRLNGNWFMQQAGAGLETLCLLLQLYHLKLLKNQCSSLNLHNYINEFFDGDYILLVTVCIQIFSMLNNAWNVKLLVLVYQTWEIRMPTVWEKDRQNSMRDTYWPNTMERRRGHVCCVTMVIANYSSNCILMVSYMYNIIITIKCY